MDQFTNYHIARGYISVYEAFTDFATERFPARVYIDMYIIYNNQLELTISTSQ